MSTLKVNRIEPRTGDSVEIVGLDIPEPPEPQVKAWVRFQGLENPPRIVCSKGVSSLTDRGTGEYRVNFTTPFEDAGKISGQCCPTNPSTARKDSFIKSYNTDYMDIDCKANDVLNDMNGVNVWVTEE